MQFNQLQVQNTGNLYRKIAFRELLNGLSGVSSQNQDIFKESLLVCLFNKDCNRCRRCMCSLCIRIAHYSPFVNH
jgi:hypothetical protein